MSRGVLNFESRDIAKIEYEININRENYTLFGYLYEITGGIKFTFSIKVSYPNFIMSEPTKSA